MSFRDYPKVRFPRSSPRRYSRSRSRSPKRRVSSEESRERNVYVRRPEKSSPNRLRYKGDSQKPIFKGAEKSISYDEKDLKSIQVNIRGIKYTRGATVTPLITKSDLILVRSQGESVKPLFSKDILHGRSSSEERHKSQEPTRVISMSDNSAYPDNRSIKHVRPRSPSPLRRRYNPSPQHRSLRNRTPDRKLRESKDYGDRKSRDDRHYDSRRRRSSRSHSSKRRTTRRHSREKIRRERSEDRRRRERNERSHRSNKSPVRTTLGRSRSPPRRSPPLRHTRTPPPRRSPSPLPRCSRTRSRSLVSISPEYEGDILQKSNGSTEGQPTERRDDRRKRRNLGSRTRRAIRKFMKNSEVPLPQLPTSTAGYVPTPMPPGATVMRPMQPWTQFRPLPPPGPPMMLPQMTRMPVVPPPPMIQGLEHMPRFPLRYFPPMHQRP